MAWRIEKQADGRFAIWSTRINDYIVIDADEAEIERIYKEKGIKVYLASARAQMTTRVDVSFALWSARVNDDIVIDANEVPIERLYKETGVQVHPASARAQLTPRVTPLPAERSSQVAASRIRRALHGRSSDRHRRHR